MTTCKRPGCTGSLRARGMCHNHYQQWARAMAKKRKAEGTSLPKSYRDLVFAALPGTMADIMERTGMGRRTIGRWISAFRREKLARIIDWQRPVIVGSFVPVHGVGSGPDAECKLIAYCATSAGAWKRRKAIATVEQREMMRNKSRTRNQVKRAGKRGDPLVLALFGPRAIGGQP